MSALLVRHSHGTIMPAAFEHVCEEVYSHCGSLAQLAAPRRAHGVPFDAVFEALIFGATGACHRREERRTRAVLEAPSVESRVRMQPVWVGGQGLRGAAHHAIGRRRRFPPAANHVRVRIGAAGKSGATVARRNGSSLTGALSVEMWLQVHGGARDGHRRGIWREEHGRMAQSASEIAAVLAANQTRKRHVRVSCVQLRIAYTSLCSVPLRLAEVQEAQV